MRPAGIQHIPVMQEMAYLFPPPGRDVNVHRAIMLPYVYERDGKCFEQGCCGYDPCTGHEAVITRGDVQSWKGDRVLIHVPYNSIYLCSKHHNTALEPKRLYVARCMVKLYGYDWLCWLETLPFNVRPKLIEQILREF